MATARAGLAILPLDESSFLAVGGTSDGHTGCSAVERFNYGTGWTQLAPLPSAAGQGVSVARRRPDEARLFVAGGTADANLPEASSAQLLCYDVQRNTWGKLPPMTTARYAAGHCVYQDQLYVLGGRRGRVAVSECEVFEFRALRWRKLPDLPRHARVFPGWASAEGRSLCVGGLDSEEPQRGFLDSALVLNLETEQWEELPAVPAAFGDGAVGRVRGHFVAAAGVGNHGRPASSCFSLPVRTDAGAERWRALPDIPSSHVSAGFALSADNSALCVAGGLADNAFSDACDILCAV